MWFVVTGGHRNSLSLSDVRAVVTEGLRRRGGCSREWVSDPASPLRDLAKGRRDGRGDSSDLNLPIVAEVASSWSQLCQSWWVSTASEDWPVEEVCPDNLHISGEVHIRLQWVATSWCGCRRSGFNRPGELEIPAVEGGDQELRGNGGLIIGRSRRVESTVFGRYLFTSVY